MSQNEKKQRAALKALDYIKPDSIVGVGTGSTVNFFIDALAQMKDDIVGAVASSEASATRLKSHGIELVELNTISEMPVYVDGADEANEHFYLIKGGGGAHTREKICAAVAKSFVCIVDDSKMVDVLGEFPLPVEVIPMARSYVARELVKLGGDPVYRQGFTTDNGNLILDVHNLKILNPVELEKQINQITGVVCHGIFAHRGADVILSATEDGIKTYEK